MENDDRDEWEIDAILPWIQAMSQDSIDKSRIFRVNNDIQNV